MKGRISSTTVRVPSIEILSPKEVVEIKTTKESSTCLIKGRTEPGNTIRINDEETSVLVDGRFEKKVNLKQGENIYRIVAANPMGYTNATKEIIILSGDNKPVSGDKFVSNKKNLPKFSVWLPKEGVVCNRKLRIKGETDPNNTVNLYGLNIYLDNEGRFVVQMEFSPGKHVIAFLVSDRKNTIGQIERTIEIGDMEGITDSTNYELVSLGLGFLDEESVSFDKERKSIWSEERASLAERAPLAQVFMVGIADYELGHIKAIGDLEGVKDDSHFQKGFYQEGRLAYYLTGKIKGKCLITSSLDTSKREQKALFKNLDPNKYYPIYGDSAKTIYDGQSKTRGQFYLLLGVNESSFVFGNYQTDF